MAWYSTPGLAYCSYLPAALLATALPFALAYQQPSQGLPQRALLGHALVVSCVALLAAVIGAGSGYVLAAWGLCSLVAAAFVSKVNQIQQSLSWDGL